MQGSKWYIKDIGDFIRKIKDIHYISSNAILVTVDMVNDTLQFSTILYLNLLKAFYIKEKTKIYRL